MPDTALNGNFARAGLLLGVVAAGFGWFLCSRTDASTALGKAARDLARSLRQRFDRAGELAPLRSLTGRPAARRVLPRKIAVEEPMAGYGA